MYHCNIHDIDHSQYECPRCFAEKQNQKLINAIEAQAVVARVRYSENQKELEYRRLNSGSYKCMHCLNISLNKGATIYILCHGTIPKSFWTELERQEELARIRNQERENKERIAREAELERTRPERERMAKLHNIRVVKATRTTNFKKTFNDLISWWGIFYMLFFPALSGWSSDISKYLTDSLIGLSVPCLGHLMWAIILFKSQGTFLFTNLMSSAIYWGIGGVVVCYLLAKFWSMSD